jgi:hypothetical protein
MLELSIVVLNKFARRVQIRQGGDIRWIRDVWRGRDHVAGMHASKSTQGDYWQAGQMGGLQVREEEKRYLSSSRRWHVIDKDETGLVPEVVDWSEPHRTL